MTPKVSFIIPCYNQAAYLPKAIASIQAQTFGDWECIVVDDGSTDNTAKVAANIALNDSRIRLLQKTNGGSASARNLGLQESQGEYIHFIDADDLIDSHKLEIQLTFMEEKQLDMSYTAFCFLNQDGKTSKLLYARLNERTILTHWGLGSSIPPHAFLYRKQFLINHQILFDEACRFREDWNFLIQCFAAHPHIGTLPKYCGAYYFQNQSGKTGSYLRMQEGNFLFMSYMLPRLKGINKLLWVFRISQEIWIWLLRMLKYHSTQNAKTIRLLPTVWIFGAVLLMPISFWWILIYFIKTYLAR